MMGRRGRGDIAPEILASLLKVTCDARDQAADINREVADDRKAAVDEHGLHAGAFGLCVRLKRMDQVKRLAFLAALDSYRHILKLDDAPQAEAFGEQQRRERAA